MFAFATQSCFQLLWYTRYPGTLCIKPLQTLSALVRETRWIYSHNKTWAGTLQQRSEGTWPFTRPQFLQLVQTSQGSSWHLLECRSSIEPSLVSNLFALASAAAPWNIDFTSKLVWRGLKDWLAFGQTRWIFFFLVGTYESSSTWLAGQLSDIKILLVNTSWKYSKPFTYFNQKNIVVYYIWF